MTAVELRCRDCLFLAEIEAEGKVAQCAIQASVRPMLFTTEELEAQRHPQGICEDGDLLPNEGVCHAYLPRGVPIKTLADHRREEMALIRQAWWILRLHNPIFLRGQGVTP